MADVISVSALNKYVKSVLESDVVLCDIAIVGEINNFVQNSKTGHCYFSLKDEKAGIKAVMFRGNAQRLAFTPKNGMRVIARGRITLYERDGSFQINVEFLFPDGEGSAHLAFEELKNRLQKEGLFEAQHKKPLPEWPKCIGLVTSKTGAALQDILRVATNRCPMARFILAPASVQGERAVPEIVDGILRLDADDEVDLIIVARGGGSSEDLWVFNDEAIARAAFLCDTPIISAIGHEIDYTILDFVADLRAPTPSAAAEMALPDVWEARRRILHIGMNITDNIHFLMESWYNKYSQSCANLALYHPAKTIKQTQKELARISQQIKAINRNIFHNTQERFKANIALAGGLNPYNVMARGYGVVMQNGKSIHSVAQADKNTELNVCLKDGVLVCDVKEKKEGQVPV